MLKVADSDLFLAIISGTVLFLMLSGFIIVFILIYQKRKSKHALEMHTLKQTYAEELLKSQLEIQEETLRNISQEIHDNIGQVLSLAKLQLNTLPEPVRGENKEAIDNSRQLIGKAITDLRSLSKSLNPDRVNELGLEENIRFELEMLEKTKKFQTRFQIKGSVYSLTAQTETIIFRMVQESLSNIIKHANASAIEITIDYGPNQFWLYITDNGTGLPTTHLESDRHTGIGLKNMQFRSKIIGALFSIKNGASGGAVITICLPKKDVQQIILIPATS